MRSAREMEADFHLLEVITSIVNSVHEPLNAEHIGLTALHALSQHYSTSVSFIHTSDPIQKAFHLLGFYSSDQGLRPSKRLQYIPYNSPTFLAKLHYKVKPLVIEKLPSAMQSSLRNVTEPLLQSNLGGIICVPLWFGDQFEGVMTAIFPEPILAQAPEILAIERIGTHIAAALSHAHLHASVENERSRLRIVLDQLPEGVLITEATDGLVSYANSSAAHLLAIPHEELVGTLFNKYLHGHSLTANNPLAASPWNFVVVRALAGETVKTQETSLVRPDGSVLTLLCSSAPLFSANNILTGAVLVFQDITKQKSLEQQKNEFLAMASHELRTPITTIQGIAEILQMYSEQDKQISNARVKQALGQVVNQSSHLTSLIDEMLDVSRIENGHFTLAKESIKLSLLLKEIVEGQALGDRNHHFDLRIEEDEIVVVVDKERFTQALNNLIKNASKYSAPGTSIEIGLRVARETDKHSIRPQAIIWIKDHGIGIAKEEIPHIYDRFYRSPSLNPSYAGLGVGLYIVQEIIAHHEGSIWVESELDKGTTFTVAVPL